MRRNSETGSLSLSLGLMVGLAAGLMGQVTPQIRSKISAGDLRSAESILEVHQKKSGEDGEYLEGLAWLARGAVLVGEWETAETYAADVRRRCDGRLAQGAELEKDANLLAALGASIEVEAQIRAHGRGKAAAGEYLRGELKKFAGPVALRSRLYKRLNLMTLEGTEAPDLVVEDSLGEALAPMRGKTTLLFLWAEWCGDCKAQAAALARVRSRHEAEGLQVVALTRYYSDDRAAERRRVEQVWKEFYRELGTVPVIFSTASMERYGGSSTPTFVFIDPAGRVRHYLPVRLTESELERKLGNR